MKKIAALLFVLAGAVPLFGQGTSFPVFNRQGWTMAGAVVSVCNGPADPGTYNLPCHGSQATTYTDWNLTTACTLVNGPLPNPPGPPLGPTRGVGCTNPGLTDSHGNATIFAANGFYWAQIAGYQVVPQTFPFNIGSGGGGGGLIPCGVVNDVQLYASSTNLGCDSGILIGNPTTHTLSDNILNANQQVDVSDATNSGLICQGHSTGSAVDSAFCTSPSATFSPTPTGGYGLFPPDNSPSGVGQAIRVTSLTPTNVTTKYGTIPFYPTSWSSASAGVSLEFLYPLDYTNAPSPTQSSDLIRTLFPQGLDKAFMGPLPPSNPLSTIVQDKVCDYQESGGGGGDVATCAFDAPTLPGNAIYGVAGGEQGLGNYPTFTVTDSKSNTYTVVDQNNGSGLVPPAANFFVNNAATGTTATTVSVHLSASGGTGHDVLIHLMEVAGTVSTAIDAHSTAAASSSPPITFASVTTLTPPTPIIATVIGQNGNTYTPGSGWTSSTATGTGFNGANGSLYTEIQNQSGTGTYTPTVTATTGGQYTTFTVAIKNATIGGPGTPNFRYIRYNADLTASGDFPVLGGNTGKCLADNATETGLSWVTCGSAASIPFTNITSGTNTAAAMVVGSGASLDYTGTGTIDANKLATHSVTGISGNTSTVGTTSGTLTNGHCVSVDASGNLVDSGAACGTGAVTSVSGTANQIDSTGGAAPVISLDGQYTTANYGTCTNTADALTVTLSPAPTSLVNGLTVQCKSSAANTTTTPTLNVNGLGAKTIVKAGASGQAALAASDILTNMVATFKYNAATTTWELQNPQQPVAGGITQVNMPSNVFTPATCTGPTCNFSFSAQSPYTVLYTPSTGTQAPIFSNQYSVNHGDAGSPASYSITLPSASSNGDAIVVAVACYGSACSVSGLTDNMGNTYTALGTGNTGAGYYLRTYRAVNITGGNLTITVAFSVTDYKISISTLEIGNVQTSPTDGQVEGTPTSCGPPHVSGSLTTTNANDVLISTFATINGGTFAYSSPFSLATTISGDGGIGGFSTGTGIGTFTVNSVGSYFATTTTACSTKDHDVILALKLATSGSNTPVINYLPYQVFWGPGAFPGTTNVLPSTSLSDTQIGLHVGTHITAANQTTAYAGTGAGSLLFTTPTGVNSGYVVHVNVKCYSAVSTATVIPQVVYTSDDGSSTVETESGTTATCTTLGTNDVGHFDALIHAKANTSVYLKTTIANSPHYNVDAFVELSTIQ